MSKGEQQLYATAILKALVEESNIEFPVFIDSPLQKFDALHAKNIISDFYPEISKQVVLFPLLEKEMTKEEYGYLEEKVKAAYIINNEHEDMSTFIPVTPRNLFTVAKKIKQDVSIHITQLKTLTQMFFCPHPTICKCFGNTPQPSSKLSQDHQTSNDAACSEQKSNVGLVVQFSLNWVSATTNWKR